MEPICFGTTPPNSRQFTNIPPANSCSIMSNIYVLLIAWSGERSFTIAHRISQYCSILMKNNFLMSALPERFLLNDRVTAVAARQPHMKCFYSVPLQLIWLTTFRFILVGIRIIIRPHHNICAIVPQIAIGLPFSVYSYHCSSSSNFWNVAVS